MKVALASLFVLAALPAFAGPALNCTINGKSLQGVLHEDNTASVSGSSNALVANIKAVRSGGYKGSSVQDVVTITISDESGTLETISAISSVSLENSSFQIQCGVSNY